MQIDINDNIQLDIVNFPVLYEQVSYYDFFDLYIIIGNKRQFLGSFNSNELFSDLRHSLEECISNDREIDSKVFNEVDDKGYNYYVNQSFFQRSYL